MGTTKLFRLIALSCCLATLAYASGQEQAHGKVNGTDQNGTSPLPGASVYWLGTTIGTATDVNGAFHLEEVGSTNQLVISFTGFVTDTVAYNGVAIDVTLETGVALDAVDVVAREDDQARFLMDPLNIQKIGGQELRKAACCNLSESFETNASIDASFTDAVTGTRQIKMLGLSGRYSQILKDNIPNVRGLATIYGLGYIPGDWIEDIYISKGAGSVTSGFESITGEINVAIKDPDTEEKAHFNLYANQGGRLEFNTNVKAKVSEHLGTIVLAHAEVNQQRMDRNGDGFLDNPLKQDFALRNQWKWRADKHWEGQYSINYLKQHNESGQVRFDSDANNGLWGMHLDGERFEAVAKTGYLFDDFFGSSIGSQFSAERYTLAIDAGEQSYRGVQETYRANLLYATSLGCKSRGLTVGLTGLIDNYTSRLDSLSLNRNEEVFGAYGEFTWTPNERFSGIAGMRIDQHNLFGTMYSPRLHLRYLMTESLSFKGAAGRGYRTANPVTDNLGLLASNREWNIEAPLVQESGWNFGLNATYKFRIDYRDASIAVDAYSTQFDRLAVVDFETAEQVNIYALEGRSYANTAQVEFSWEALRRVDLRMAYRYTDARTSYRQGLLINPFNPLHRGFVSLSYETKPTEKQGQWKVDGTIQLIGEQRLPSTRLDGALIEYTAAEELASPDFVQVHGQITRIFKKGLELYLGIENATNYRQADPIISNETPFADSFDASQVWAPIFGSMGYAGLRWTLY